MGTKVCVVGGGPAGIAAANEAALRGSEVTLYECSDGLPPSRTEWPSLIDSSPTSPDAAPRSVLASEVKLRLGVKVSTVSSRGRIASGEGPRTYDRVVVATGSKPLEPDVLGIRKKHSIVLSGPADYVELRELKELMGRVIISGSPLRAVAVADRIVGSGRKVSLLVPGGFHPEELHPELSKLLRSLAEQSGVNVLDSALDRLAGVDAVEAGIAGSNVVPCDHAIIVPELAPSLPYSGFVLGPRGGAALNYDMWSPSGGCFAAGGCAELGSDPSRGSLSLRLSPKESGRVAGANASGGNELFSWNPSVRIELFGLQFVSEGILWRDAIRSGSEVRTSSFFRQDNECSVIFRRKTRQVLGVGLASGRAFDLAPLLRLAVRTKMDLQALADLAYEDSTDISLVSEAASQGVAQENKRGW